MINPYIICSVQIGGTLNVPRLIFLLMASPIPCGKLHVQGRLGLGRCWQCLRYRFYVFLCQQIPAQYPEGPMSFYIPSLSSLSNSTRSSCILFCYHPLVSAISAADSLLQPFSSTPFIPGSVTGHIYPQVCTHSMLV